MEGRILDSASTERQNSYSTKASIYGLKGKMMLEKSHTPVDQLGEKLLTGGVLDSGSASSVGSSLRKSCPQRQLQFSEREQSGFL